MLYGYFLGCACHVPELAVKGYQHRLSAVMLRFPGCWYNSAGLSAVVCGAGKANLNAAEYCVLVWGVGIVAAPETAV
jgi:hypothetical protein